ncbi:MAG: hypothetical protein IT211_00010 [Armatimonadetes bacterium]|nr:hypothetical protein [Armatimonadota bacterium]
MSQSLYDTARKLAAAAVRYLPERWGDTKVNRSGLRSTFRRWRPDASGVPSIEMRAAIWGDNYLYACLPEPATDESADDQRNREWHTQRMIDQAAILVSLRAVAGDHAGAPAPFGKALLQSGLSDTRFARFVTTPPSGRLEALRRALQTTEHEGAVVDWTKETYRFHHFLFGTPDQAKNAVDAWAADFFRARGKAAKDAADGKADTENTTDDAENN